MAFFQIDLFSKTMDLSTRVDVVIPETIEAGEVAAAPVVFLLHGLSDDCSAWSRLTRAEYFARKHKICLVMPEVQRGFYTDMKYGLDYFTYISRELPVWCRDYLNLAGPRYVMGLSMGGFGALKCYLTCRETFIGCASFSGVVDLRYVYRMEGPQRIKENMALWGDVKDVAPENDITGLLKAQETPGKIYLSCGTEDFLYRYNRDFARELEKGGHDCVIDFRPGIHEWGFWDTSLEKAVEWFFPLQA